MDCDDEFDNGYDDMAHDSNRVGSMPDEPSEGAPGPLDIANLVSAYLFLRDDAQDEINGIDRKRIKCLSSGHRFMGEIYDWCPECFSSDAEVVADEKDHRYW